MCCLGAVGGEVALGLRLEKGGGGAREANWALGSQGRKLCQKRVGVRKHGVFGGSQSSAE